MESLLPPDTIEKVKGVAAPLATNYPFYVLLESSGSDAERIRGDLEKLLEQALGDDIILDATIASSGAAAAAIWRIRDSSVELGRALGTRADGLRHQPCHRQDGGIADAA